MAKNEVDKELEKLNKIFRDIPEDSKKLCEGLIENAAFMYVALKRLQEAINEHGTTITAKGGNGYEIVKENPAQKAYTTMIAKYTDVIKQLNNMLPSDKNAPAGEALMGFVTKS